MATSDKAGRETSEYEVPNSLSNQMEEIKNQYLSLPSVSQSKTEKKSDIPFMNDPFKMSLSIERNMSDVVLESHSSSDGIFNAKRLYELSFDRRQYFNTDRKNAEVIVISSSTTAKRRAVLTSSPLPHEKFTDILFQHEKRYQWDSEKTSNKLPSSAVLEEKTVQQTADLCKLKFKETGNFEQQKISFINEKSSSETDKSDSELFLSKSLSSLSLERMTLNDDAAKKPKLSRPSQSLTDEIKSNETLSALSQLAKRYEMRSEFLTFIGENDEKVKMVKNEGEPNNDRFHKFHNKAKTRKVLKKERAPSSLSSTIDAFSVNSSDDSLSVSYSTESLLSMDTKPKSDKQEDSASPHNNHKSFDFQSYYINLLCGFDAGSTSTAIATSSRTSTTISSEKVSIQPNQTNILPSEEDELNFRQKFRVVAMFFFKGFSAILFSIAAILKILLVRGALDFSKPLSRIFHSSSYETIIDDDTYDSISKKSNPSGSVCSNHSVTQEKKVRVRSSWIRFVHPLHFLQIVGKKSCPNMKIVNYLEQDQFLLMEPLIRKEHFISPEEILWRRRKPAFVVTDPKTFSAAVKKEIMKSEKVENDHLIKVNVMSNEKANGDDDGSFSNYNHAIKSNRHNEPLDLMDNEFRYILDSPLEESMRSWIGSLKRSNKD